jgi:hypothetical protein
LNGVGEGVGDGEGESLGIGESVGTGESLGDGEGDGDGDATIATGAAVGVGGGVAGAAHADARIAMAASERAARADRAKVRIVLEIVASVRVTRP